ncbi:glycosyltransferase [Castellaniella sp. MT123]|uniref:glycosyltransferase n=1 Tax=Castellaniella sp. MT123 TaxID=3140381 RepID=UPI0031F3D723
MRILLVTTGLALGGAERQVMDLAERLAGRGHEVAIAYLVGAAELRPQPSVALLPMGFTKSPLGLIGGCWRLGRLVRDWQPDVVHSHMVDANLLTRLVRLISPMRRLVCTAHNTNEGGRWVSLAYRLTDRLADLSTNVSQEAVDAFERNGAVPKGRMLAVLNGIDLRRFLDAPELRAKSRDALCPDRTRRLLLSVGRLVEQKNHAGLLRVFAGFAARCPDVDLWIAGDGPLRAALRRQCDDLGLGGRVVWLGARADVPDLMRAADAFVLSSHFEGFGLVVAEAMASGTPVVATDAGGVAEVMAGTGFLVPVDDETALAHALDQVFALGGELRMARVAAARRSVEDRLDIERVVETWLKLYQGEIVC